MAIINSLPCGQLYRKIPLPTGNPADADTLAKNFDLIERAFDLLRNCLLGKIAEVASTIDVGSATQSQQSITSQSDFVDRDESLPIPGPRGLSIVGRRGPRGIPGEDGEDGDDGKDGDDGITPQTYFDLFLSYGDEHGDSALMDRVGADPDFYLRPNTNKTVINQYEGSAGSTWEYEVTTELFGTLVLDCMVYYCGLTGFGGTPTLVVSVTKNGAPILTSSNLDGSTNIRVFNSLAGVSYTVGDRMGIRVTTTNFSSGALMMTAHARCEEKVIAAGGIIGPPGPQGDPGISIQGPPGINGESFDDLTAPFVPGINGINGTNGNDGQQGVPGTGGEDGDAGIFIPPQDNRLYFASILKWSAYYNSGDAGSSLPGFFGDYGGPAVTPSRAPFIGSTTNNAAWFYGLPSPGIIRNLRVYFNFVSGASATVTIYKNGVATSLSITATSSGAYADTADIVSLTGSPLIDCAIQTGTGGDSGLVLYMSVTAELWLNK